ncbi:hypothetical protein C8R45DRAFT_912071 [Mycena sanguinolenta]|nr:hypothetical protein C8R45DRAFT_912071 [Mycena sanguinolenta]
MATTQVCHNCGASRDASPSFASLLKPLPPSPSAGIARLLNTNDPPLDAEISVVRQLICDDEDRLDELDSRILHFQTILAQLVKMRTQIARHLRKHRAVVSPIRHIPAELVCDIFDLSTVQSRAMPEATPPWGFGLISRRWRQYALGYPPLWSSLTAPASQPYSYGNNWITQQLPKLENQLLRSGMGPLDLHWSHVDYDVIPDSRILDLILPQSKRWRMVSFHRVYRPVHSGRPMSMLYHRTNGPDDVELDWLQPVCGKLDGLERVEMVDLICTTFLDVFATAPNLRKVVGIPLPSAPGTSIEIPWKQITYHQGTHSFAQQLDILRAAPNLSSCSLDITDFVLPTDATVTLPQLRRLCLDHRGFLLHIVAPNLEELRCVDYELKIQILPFVHRASCTLQRLVLWQCPLHIELISTLRNLPSLIYLFLQNDWHLQEQGVAFFAAMTISGSTADICPRLTSMVYGHAEWNHDASQESFVHMARSRFLPNPSGPFNGHFTSLRLLPTDLGLDTYVPPDAKLKARVQLLQNEGFNVAFLGEGETTEHLRCKYD